jgi:ATP-dependent RNA helicase DeaD
VVQALILAPTRELCQQITDEIKKLTKHKRAKVVAVYGGVSINPQIDALADAQVVVGTPGRILDHLERDTLRTGHIKFLVLDEADRMFDMGFIEDMERIIQAIPNERQTLLFSATMPEAIKSLTSRYQRHPEHVKVQTHVEEHLLPQFYYVVEHNRKFSLLCHLITKEDPKLGIIFCATRHIADVIAKNLHRQRIDAQPIHGGLSQAKRDRVMADFKEGKVHILVATDVAARGLDIKNVTHVFNYDVPKNSEDYIHRIGRTARAGESGKAITLLENRDFEFFQGVLELPNVHPTELNAGEYKSVGFRKHDDGDRDGEFSGRREGRGEGRGYGSRGPSGPRRDGGRPRRDGDRPRRDGDRPRRDGGNSGGGYASGSGERHESHSSHSSSDGSGGWRQTRKRR